MMESRTRLPRSLPQQGREQQVTLTFATFSTAPTSAVAAATAARSVLLVFFFFLFDPRAVSVPRANTFFSRPLSRLLLLLLLCLRFMPLLLLMLSP